MLRTNLRTKVKGAVLVGVLAAIASAEGAPGSLDPTLGGDGVVVTDFGRHTMVNAVAVQSDGKILSAGQYGFNDPGYSQGFIARNNADGTPDTSFGTGGIAMFGGVQGDDHASAVGLDSLGSIYVTGRYHAWVAGKGRNAGKVVRRFAAVKLRADGSLDPAFGVSGISVVSLSDDDNSRDLVLDEAAGRLYLAGDAYTGKKTGRDIAIVALRMSDGGLDSGFGNGGIAIVAPSKYLDAAWRVCLDSQGRVVFAGVSDGHPLLVGRLRFDGSLDSSFGGRGWMIDTTAELDLELDFAGGSGSGLAIQADDRILLAGRLWEGWAEKYGSWIRRYEVDGSLDTGFGVSGTAHTLDPLDPDPVENQGQAIAVGSDGSIYLHTSLVVSAVFPVDVDTAVWTFAPDGTRLWRSEQVSEHPEDGGHNATCITLAPGVAVVGGAANNSGGTTPNAMLARILR